MVALSKNKIKWVRSLRLKKNRDAEGLFVAEGSKIVQEILDEHPESIVCLITIEPDFQSEMPTFVTDAKTMKSISSFQTPGSLMAIVRKPAMSTENTGWTIALDGIQDPGNLGTIIRTADWFGVTSIICSKNTVDCFNPKVVQSTMGSIFRVRVSYEDLREAFEQDSRPVYGALMEGQDVHSILKPDEGILLMGNEGKGISPELASSISHPIHIPGKGKAESLNVAVATGILLSELV